MIDRPATRADELVDLMHLIGFVAVAYIVIHCLIRGAT